MTRHTLKGLWYDSDGFLRDNVAPSLHVVRDEDGNLYDADSYDFPCGVPPLRLTVERGQVHGWGEGYFSPDAGELERL